MEHPCRKECLEYLKKYNTPDHVIGHCKSVAAVAYTLGKAVNQAGGTLAAPIGEISFRKTKISSDSGRFEYVQVPENLVPDAQSQESPLPERRERLLDLDLILSAGLLHDMARVEENHWDVCADWCREKGLLEEEKIIRIHMQYKAQNNAFNLTEADIVCLGDRLSLEDRYAGLDRRMEYIIKKAERHGQHKARERILKRKQETRALLDQIEDRIGVSLDRLMEDIDYDNVETGMEDDKGTR